MYPILWQTAIGDRLVQVSFHNQKMVKKISVTKTNEIVNRLNRSKKELYPDLAQEREAYDRVIRTQRKAEVQAQRKADKAAKTEAERQKDLRSYKHLLEVSDATARGFAIIKHTYWP